MLDIHVISLGKGVEGTGNSAHVCQFVCSSTARVITRTDNGTQPRAPITSASAAKRQTCSETQGAATYGVPGCCKTFPLGEEAVLLCLRRSFPVSFPVL